MVWLIDRLVQRLLFVPQLALGVKMPRVGCGLKLLRS
jgi:hypothetical protein